MAQARLRGGLRLPVGPLRSRTGLNKKLQIVDPSTALTNGPACRVELRQDGQCLIQRICGGGLFEFNAVGANRNHQVSLQRIRLFNAPLSSDGRLLWLRSGKNTEAIKWFRRPI